MVCASLLFLSFGLFAQWTVAPVVGGTLSNITSPKELGFPNSKALPNFSLGFQGKYDISERFGIGLALSYVGKGFRYELNLPPILESSIGFRYFDATVFAEYKPIKQMGILLGGGYGLLKEERFKIDGQVQDHPTSFQLAEDHEINATAGLRYYFEHFFLSVTYNCGLSPVIELIATDGNGEKLYDAASYNQTIQVGVGYNFHLKKKQQ